MRCHRIFRTAEPTRQNPGQAVADYARQGENTAGSNTDAPGRMINRTPAKPNAAAHWIFSALSLSSGAESIVIAVISKGIREMIAVVSASGIRRWPNIIRKDAETRPARATPGAAAVVCATALFPYARRKMPLSAAYAGHDAPQAVEQRGSAGKASGKRIARGEKQRSRQHRSHRRNHRRPTGHAERRARGNIRHRAGCGGVYQAGAMCTDRCDAVCYAATFRAARWGARQGAFRHIPPVVGRSTRRLARRLSVGPVHGVTTGSSRRPSPPDARRCCPPDG